MDVGAVRHGGMMTTWTDRITPERAPQLSMQHRHAHTGRARLNNPANGLAEQARLDAVPQPTRESVRVARVCTVDVTRERIMRFPVLSAAR